jgi:predicted nucleotidyltransferase component of viral defense system
VLPVARREVKLPWREETFTALSVAPLEIFASKTVALLTRTAPRDLYDMHNMVKFELFDESETDMLRKCAVFYSAIGAEKPPVKFELDNIRNVSAQQIKRVFGQTQELKNISKHPMALWKCRNKNGDIEK